MTFYEFFLHLVITHFNSHARVGRDYVRTACIPANVHFNSHARVGRDSCIIKHCIIFLYFNSHARVGRDFMAKDEQTIFIISTHTPAWGVTLLIFFQDSLDFFISTHTPAWGVTLKFSSGGLAKIYFNSHARVGRDFIRPWLYPASFNFNSHARVGRDLSQILKNTKQKISTHTPAWGVTAVTVSLEIIDIFQLTRPRGA